MKTTLLTFFPFLEIFIISVDSSSDAGLISVLLSPVHIMELCVTTLLYTLSPVRGFEGEIHEATVQIWVALHIDHNLSHIITQPLRLCTRDG